MTQSIDFHELDAAQVACFGSLVRAVRFLGGLGPRGPGIPGPLGTPPRVTAYDVANAPISQSAFSADELDLAVKYRCRRLTSAPAAFGAADLPFVDGSEGE